MSLNKSAQFYTIQAPELEVVEEPSVSSEEPLIVVDEVSMLPAKNQEAHEELEDSDLEESHRDSNNFENVQLEVVDEPQIQEQGPVTFDIVLSDIPGAECCEEDEDLEVVDEDNDDENKEEIEIEEPKKSDKWNWTNHGEGFVSWIKERFNAIPRHSGKDTAGLERALSYLDKLDSEISKAMRLDLDGELDADAVEQVRVNIHDGMERIKNRLSKYKSSKKKKKANVDFEIVKEAQKITGVKGVYVTVPLLISRIARICINSMVSAGHDIEDVFKQQAKKYKLTDREKAEVIQLLEDMGYATRSDRGFLSDEEIDASSSDNFDWSANYQG